MRKQTSCVRITALSGCLGTALGWLPALLIGCGEVPPPMPQPDLSPRCTQSGLFAPSSADCCSLQRDYQGLCCSGTACEPPKPDLTVSAFSLSTYPPNSPTGTLFLCLNSDSSGKAIDRGEYVRIKNSGTAAAIPYKVGLGVVRSTDLTKEYYCQTLLQKTGSQDAGVTAEWKGPICCSFSVGEVPTGYYYTAVYADFNSDVTEKSESNNRILSSRADILIP